MFKDSLVNYYQRADTNFNLRCMITNQSYARKYVRASHLLKRCTDGDLMHYFGLEPNIDHPRNGLLLLDPVEQLFDRKDLCFLYDPITQQFQAKLLNINLRNETMCAEDGTSFNQTYGSVDGLVLQLPQGIFPYRRVLSLHAKFSYSRALNRGWIAPTENLETYFRVSDSGIEEPLGFGLLSWQEVHNCIHQQVASLFKGEEDA